MNYIARRISHHLPLIGLLLLGFFTFALGAAKPANNILVGRCYQQLPCTGTGSEIYWDPNAGTEGGWGGSGCVLFKNMLHTNLRVSTAGCDVADTMAPGTCKASAYGPWQRLCPNKKGTQGQDQREERR